MSQFLFIYWCYYEQRPDIKSIKIHISSILLDIHMVYVYKATISLSVQKYVHITKLKNITHWRYEGKKYGMPTINLLWYLIGMLVIFDKLHLK